MPLWATTKVGVLCLESIRPGVKNGPWPLGCDIPSKYKPRSQTTDRVQRAPVALLATGSLKPLYSPGGLNVSSSTSIMAAAPLPEATLAF